ncbi:hypothetical protein RJ640_019735 [Escallonia rubra]|uniref:non-specific serine/threonine protein kinase n=1 Tax=Escallonia rubra TaxID=112253 RepID=A0AA88RD13_9ASTE|nr:hypothetical protein RJ640_019735 [Escallonia rubra]
MGSTGIVFKAEIHRPHSVAAVKKFWRSEADMETGDDLLADVNLLGRLRHRNIVRLLGYLHNETDIMMVNEYMPNGNLGEAIHGKQAGKMTVVGVIFKGEPDNQWNSNPSSRIKSRA